MHGQSFYCLPQLKAYADAAAAWWWNNVFQKTFVEHRSFCAVFLSYFRVYEFHFMWMHAMLAMVSTVQCMLEALFKNV